VIYPIYAHDSCTHQLSRHARRDDNEPSVDGQALSKMRPIVHSLRASRNQHAIGLDLRSSRLIGESSSHGAGLSTAGSVALPLRPVCGCRSNPHPHHGDDQDEERQDERGLEGHGPQIKTSQGHSSDHPEISATSIMRQSHHYWSYNKDVS